MTKTKWRYVEWDAKIMAAVCDDDEEEVQEMIQRELARLTAALDKRQGAVMSSGPSTVLTDIQNPAMEDQ